MASLRRVLSVCALLAGWAHPLAAQTSAVPPPAAVDAAPLPPPGTAAAPSATIVQSPPPAPPAPPGPAQTARPTLIPDPGDASNVDEVVLPERPVLVLAGSSTWEDGLKNLRAAFATIEAELAKDGVAPAGRPLAVFTETSDETFRFDAMVPVASTPLASPPLGAGMRWGATPSGKAYRFVHKAPYDDIDSTYETITAYLDAKDIVARDAFIEEYPDDVTDPGDPNLEINIFVQPK